MKTILEIIRLSQKFLEDRGIAFARRTSEEIVAYTMSMNRMDLYLYHDRPVNEKELKQMRLLLKKSSSGMPLEYILGRVQFSNLEFYINEDVLVPRPETELLLEYFEKKTEQDDFNGKFLWDLCTGSGILGISLKKRFEKLNVSASDLSESALVVARKNALKLEADVRLLQGDLLEPFLDEKAHFVVANPPYISHRELKELQNDYEPKIALDGGKTGLEFYERLAQDLPDRLHSKAKVFLEIGYSQAVPVKEIFQNKCWNKKEIFKDWSGHDRFFFLEME